MGIRAMKIFKVVFAIGILMFIVSLLNIPSFDGSGCSIPSPDGQYLVDVEARKNIPLAWERRIYAVLEIRKNSKREEVISKVIVYPEHIPNVWAFRDDFVSYLKIRWSSDSSQVLIKLPSGDYRINVKKTTPP